MSGGLGLLGLPLEVMPLHASSFSASARMRSASWVKSSGKVTASLKWRRCVVKMGARLSSPAAVLRPRAVTGTFCGLRTAVRTRRRSIETKSGVVWAANLCGKFSKRPSSRRKQPDQTRVHLEKHLRNCNSLAQNPLCYRYTIPQ
jgi:hypothetical protein